jgi:hypothetical protein
VGGPGVETASARADGPRLAGRAAFVAGAGRSGTSALTRGLQALGVDLGDRLKRPTRKNPTGFFEDVDLLRIAKRARTELGLRAESVALVDPEAFDSPAIAALQDEAAELIRRRFGHAAIWGFKYAQTLRLFPFWEGIFERLGLDVRFVVAVRNPLSVARSRAQLDELRGIQAKTDLEWLVNVVPFFRSMARHPFAVVDYDLLMDAPVAQLERVARLLDIPIDEPLHEACEEYAAGFLRPGLRHTRFDADDLEAMPVHALVRAGYGWLRRLASEAIGGDDPELWGGWGEIEESLAQWGPALAHIDRLEAELRRSFRPLASVRALWSSMPHLWRGPWSRAGSKATSDAPANVSDGRPI